MRARGMTLIEMTVALAISAIAVGAGMVLLIGSQRSFQAGTDERAVQETARVAMQELTSSLGTAGYGLEPTYTFDTGLLSETVMDGLPGGSVASFGGYVPAGAPACNGTCRDHVDAPDELVFYSRNPDYGRGVAEVSPSGPSITLDAAAGDLERGQVLQIICYGKFNQWLWAYVTVLSVDASDPVKPKVALAPAPGGALEIPYQNTLLSRPCFGFGAEFVRAFKVDRYRYYIAAVDEAGAVQPWETAGARPYLMLDRGFSSGGKAVATAVAPDVEDLQVAYVFPLAEGQQVLGATPGTEVDADNAGDDAGFNLKPKATDPTALNYGIPSFTTGSRDPLRTTHQPTNMRAVRIAITVRSPRADTSAPGTTATVPAVFNRQQMAGEAGYKRMVFESTVYLHNFEMRLRSFPLLMGSCDAGNCGGG